MSKELIVSSTAHETKVAIFEDDQVVEVYFEREQEYSLAGSIYKGRVTRVLPGMQSAFVNIGLERDAFLYVSDFFEDNEEYDALVSATEDKVARMERESREAARGAAPAPEAVAVSTSPDVPFPAGPVLVAPPAGAAPAPGKPADRDNRDRHHRRRRRRGRDRGFPESKYGGGPGGPGPQHETPSVILPEPAAEAEEAEEPVATVEAAPEAPVVRQAPIILPGESLAKYRNVTAVPTAEIASPTPVEPEPVIEAVAEPVVEAVAEPVVEAVAEPVHVVVPEPEPSPEVPEPTTEPEPERAPAFEAADPEPIIFVEEETVELVAEESDELPLPEDDLTAEGVTEETTTEEITESEPEPEPGDAQPDPTAVSMRGPKPERPYAQPGRRNRRRGRDQRPSRPGAPSAAPSAGPSAGPSRQESRPTRGQPLIGELLREGQEIIVQIAKEPIGNKGARITSHLALPGRYLVYMPTVDHVGVSRRIASDEERQRLKRMLTEFRRSVNMPGGFIVRTAAEGRSDEDLRADMRFLFNLWKEQRAEAERKSAPVLLHRDLNLVERILRDQISSGFSAIWVDSEIEYAKIVDFVQLSAPSLAGRVKLYTKDTPIFEEFGVQEQINNAMKPKVWLKSGGYIVINQTEALVAIDINTGKYVGKTQRLEDTIVKTNVDAIKEIVRQIRLRDLGGIIVIDFIDMDERKNRTRVMQALEEALRADRAPSKALAFNDFGLVAITRKRVKQPLEKALGCVCPYCSGGGYVKSPQTISLEILAEAKKMVSTFERNTITIRANPEVAKYLKQPKVGIVAEIEELAKRPVMVKGDVSLHQENFDIQ